MRILFTSHYALPHVGGVEFIIDMLARRFTERGHHVTHLASGEVARDVPYRVIGVPAWNVLERAGVPYPLFSPRVWPVVREEVRRAEVVNAHGMLYQNSAIAMRVARRLGRARVLTEHVAHVPYANAIVNAIEAAAIVSLGRSTVRAAQTVVVYNAAVEEQMRRLVPHVAVEFIGNGVDTAMFHPPEPGERERLRVALRWDERPRALFVGRLVEKKGVRLAIEAARHGGGAFEVVLVGRGTVDPSPHIQILGEQPRERVAQLYRAADVFLLPSTGEGFPLAAQEAMASGMPVILSNDPAYPPVLNGSGRGAILVPRDTEAIAKAIVDLIRYGATRAGEEAHQFAREHFDWSATVDRYLDLFDRLLSTRAQ